MNFLEPFYYANVKALSRRRYNLLFDFLYDLLRISGKASRFSTVTRGFEHIFNLECKGMQFDPPLRMDWPYDQVELEVEEEI